VLAGEQKYGRKPLNRGGRLICDLFIRSYWKDLDWLRFCLESIATYCHGFRAVVVVLPESSRAAVQRRAPWRDVRVEWCRDYRDDYLGQQATKLLADLYTDADLICHVDSDCIFQRSTSPRDLMRDGRPRIVRRPNERLGRRHPWRASTEKFLGWPAPYDFMQRPPFLYPRHLYPLVRAHAIAVHGVDIETYLAAQPVRGFSEFNVLGALAWARHRDEFAWVDDNEITEAPYCRWFWSWGGLDAATRQQIQQILRAPAAGSAR
jgi:hypothetical protein